MTKVSRNYKNLVVWQKSMDLVVKVYELTEHFSKSELYGLTSQMRRAAVSIPSNIAEGSKRGTDKDFCYFLTTSFGSGAELETQIEIARRLSFGSELDYSDCESLLDEVMKMLNKLIFTIKV
jgi:four helix bundle protein